MHSRHVRHERKPLFAVSQHANVSSMSSLIPLRVYERKQ